MLMVIDEWWPFSGAVQNDSISQITQEKRRNITATETRCHNDVKGNFKATMRQTNGG